MAFLSVLGGTSCSSGVFRMTHAVLSILVMFVCLAHTLEVNSTLTNLKKEIQALELMATSMKETYNTQQDALADMITENDHLTDATLALIQKAVPQLSANKKHLEAAKESNAELKAKLHQISNDMKLMWENIQKEIERANQLVHILEVTNKEL
ncbi:unnamed protein product [Lota lota]